ncbi:unnamed protein product [Hermetia illucens]|uniref:Peptidase S1 domain-containing protein n=1 Tax=Hermetia illucens TaxID=343691 RepID=A0A7R8UP71_HERIL|nr:serine protease snake-like [Hermetia illucens]CAD7084462.1 unnamed protein product [Hermetia illucens]
MLNLKLLAAILIGFITTQTKSLQTTSEKKCAEFHPVGNTGNLVFIEPTARGYESAKLNEFPYMVAIGWKSKNETTFHQCGGVVIDPRYVIGPAFCVQHLPASKRPSIILLGSLNLESPQTVENTVGIKTMVIHPNRTERGVNDDIVIYELEESVSIRPTCLWTKADITASEGTSLMYDTETGKSGKLIKIQRKIYSDYECFKSYEKYPRVNQGIGTTQFCAAELNPDDCHTETFEGPLLIQERKSEKNVVPYLIGLSSFGGICGRFSAPTVYTKISGYINWIESVVWSNVKN